VAGAGDGPPQGTYLLLPTDIAIHYETRCIRLQSARQLPPGAVASSRSSDAQFGRPVPRAGAYRTWCAVGRVMDSGVHRPACFRACTPNLSSWLTGCRSAMSTSRYLRDPSCNTDQEVYLARKPMVSQWKTKGAENIT